MASEPLLVSGMRRRPTGEVRHLPADAAMSGTSTRGFLAEFDEALAEAEARGAARVRARVRIVHEERSVPFPDKWKFGAQQNYVAGYRAALDSVLAAITDTGGTP